MSLFKKPRRKLPELNTAALPDLIFTVLFFFLTVTHMREVTMKVKYRVPEGTELTKLTRKSAITHIYIGKPTPEMQDKAGKGTRIQVNDKYVDTEELIDFIVSERSRMSPEDAQMMKVSIKSDRETEMGIIDDVRQALRKAGVTQISFSAVSENRDKHSKF